MLVIALSTAFAGEPTGTWEKAPHRIEIEAGAVKMFHDGMLAQEGDLRVEEPGWAAAMNGCGATMKLDGEKLVVALDGPECPIELAGTYEKKVAATHCASPDQTRFSCDIQSKKGTKRLEVCEADGLTYHFGAVGKPELSLKDGKRALKSLAMGQQYDFAFHNDGYDYTVFVVESARAQDNGAGVMVEKDGAKVATLVCAEGWQIVPEAD